MPAKDHKVLSQLEFEKKQNINVKIVSAIVASGSSASNTEEDVRLLISI